MTFLHGKGKVRKEMSSPRGFNQQRAEKGNAWAVAWGSLRNSLGVVILDTSSLSDPAFCQLLEKKRAAGSGHRLDGSQLQVQMSFLQM